MLITNCNIIFEDRIEAGSVKIENNKIVSINPIEVDNDDIVDAKGMYLSPGFIDVHIHGASGFDVMDGTYEAINGIAKSIMEHGTTSFLATTMTCHMNEIKNAISAVAESIKKGTEGANVLGVHLEGPFISPFAIGAQNPEYIQQPTIKTFENIVENNINIISSVTLAPEVEGAMPLIKYLCKHNIAVSAGHTKASYKQTIEAIDCGICHSTHLFNAMTGFQHREPGVVGAIFDSDITSEIICDGIHIAYPSLRVAFKQKGLDKMLLITDAMSACCMKEGTYSLGGQAVYVKNEEARLENGALAGSVLTMDKAVGNIKNNTAYKLNEIVKMATVNAAKHCKVEDRKGLIKEGYDADLIIFDDDINIKIVIIDGKIMFNNNN